MQAPPADEAAVERVLKRLGGPLPRQKQPLWRLPAVLLNWEFAPAWPRVAALACCAALGFVVGIAGLDRPFDRLDASLTAGSRDIGSIVSEPDLLDGRTAMSIAQAFPAMERGSSRWLLLGSLALNLFFVGVAIAMAVRAPAPSYWDRNVFVRVERLAATLPPADAEILRSQINASRAAIEDAQAAYHTAQDQIHEVLRQEPFDVEAIRAAMAKTRAGPAGL